MSRISKCQAVETRSSGDPNAEPAAYLTTTQLAAYVGASLRKLERDRQDGTGVPFSKFGRRVLYRRADVEAYLADRKYVSTAESKATEGDR